MLSGKWTPMNRDVQKFNSLVLETNVMSGENDDDLMTRVEVFYKTHTGLDFKHKSAWLFLKHKYKWKTPESTLARRNRLQVTNEQPEHFEKASFSRPRGVQRIDKSQRSSSSTASSGSNPAMFQEMMQQQYELDRRWRAPRKSKAQRFLGSSSATTGSSKTQITELMQQQILLDHGAKKELMDPELAARLAICEIQKRNEDLKILTFDTIGMNLEDAAKIEALKDKTGLRILISK
nr:hypothetical protein [Tanacetum cinerariifolium]